MAVRFNCPIYTYEFILDAAGVVLEETEEEGAPAEQRNQPASRPAALSSYSIDALNKMLEEVLAEENYERAAEIRDEIRRREQTS